MFEDIKLDGVCIEIVCRLFLRIQRGAQHPLTTEGALIFIVYVLTNAVDFCIDRLASLLELL